MSVNIFISAVLHVFRVNETLQYGQCKDVEGRVHESSISAMLVDSEW